MKSQRCWWLMVVLIVVGIVSGCIRGSAVTQPDDTTNTVESGLPLSTTTPSPSPSPPSSPVTNEPTPSPTAIATAPPPATITPVPVVPTATPSPTPTASPTPEDDLPVIVLDPGHDQTWPGALGIEYQEVLRTALVTQAALEAAGYRVFLTRTDNDTVFVDDPTLLPLNAGEIHPGYDHAYAHATAALRFEPDLIFVLHFNGNANPDVAGIEVYYCENGGAQNVALAGMIRDELVAALASVGYATPSARVLEDLPVARGNRNFPSLGNIYDTANTRTDQRYAGIPVALTEPLYMTNPTERALIVADATHAALALVYVRAADRYFGR